MKNRCRPCLLVAGIACLCLCAGCPAPADDPLEPNDSAETATPLTAGVPVEGRAVQGNIDVFSVTSTAGREVIFILETIDGEDCGHFTVLDEGGAVLYADGRQGCGRVSPAAVQVEGAGLAVSAEGTYRLTVPAQSGRTYYLLIRELPYADNLVPNAWDYRLTAVTP